MGSFYMTGHSGVITDGQECVLMYVVQIDSVYGQFKPISGPMYCTYSDYGTWQLNEKSKETFEDFSEYIKPRLVNFELGENKYHDIAVNSDLFTWDFTFDMLHERRFEIKTCYDNRIKQVKAFVVHKSYYDTIMENYGLEGTKETLSKEVNERLETYNSLSRFEKTSFRFRESSNFKRRIHQMEADECEGEFWTETFLKDDEENFGIIPQYRKDYLTEAYCFNQFIRNASLDYFPTNYAGQEHPNLEALLHIKALERTLATEFFDDLEEHVYGVIYDDYKTDEERESYLKYFLKAIDGETISTIMENKTFIDVFYRYCKGN